MIENEMREKILENALSLVPHGVNDLAWEQDDALNLINSLLNDDIGILGGDVYVFNSDPVAYQIHRYKTGFVTLKSLTIKLQHLLNENETLDSKKKDKFQELLIQLEVICSMALHDHDDKEVSAILNELTNLK